MKRLIASLALASPLLATALDFPASGWDISATDETGWNAPIPASETCYFNAEYGHVLRATADVSFWRMKFSSIASGTVFDLNQDGNHTVKILDTSSAGYGFQLANSNTGYSFRGGVWDFNGSQCLHLGNGTSGNTLVFDQAILTNVLKVSLAHYAERHDNTLILTNSTRVMMSGDFCLGDNGGYGNTVRVYSGCDVNVGGKLRSDDGGTVRARSNMRMFLRGEKASLWAAHAYWAANSGGSCLSVSDGAALSGYYVHLGFSEAASNGVIVVENGATLAPARGIYVGEKGACSTLLVSNATFSITNSGYDNLMIGKEAGSSNSLVRIVGASANLKGLTWTTTLNGPFGYAGYCTFELADHVALKGNLVPSMTIGSVSDGNVFRLRDGTTVADTSALTYTAGKAASGATPATKDNRLEILGDSYLQCYRVQALGDNCGLVVSNSTLTVVNSYEHGVILGGTGATNNYLRLEGASPCVRTSWDANGVKMSAGARIEFVLPETPYASEVLHVHKILADSTCALKFDTSAIDSKPHGKLRYHLAKVRFDDEAQYLDASVLAAANAELAPKGGSLAWEGQDLYLTFRSNRGLCVVFR